MKRIYSMLLAAAAFPALAGVPAPQFTVSPVPAEMSVREYMKANNLRPQKAVANAAGEEGELTAIVTPPADAELKTYTRSAEGYYVLWGQARRQMDEGIVGEFAFCENGDVYLKNPISFRTFDTWIKGTKDGDKITFQFPQFLGLVPYDEEDESTMTEIWVNILKGTADNLGITYAFDDSVNNSVTFTLDAEEGTLTYEEPMFDFEMDGQFFDAPETMMGITDANNNWLGYGDFFDVYEPFDRTPTLIPENLTVQEYAMQYSMVGKWVNFAIDEENKEIYIAGIYTPEDNKYADLSKSAIKGKMIDGGVEFQSGQYLGIDPYYYYAFLSGCDIIDESTGEVKVVNPYYMTSNSDWTKLISGYTLVISEGLNQGYVLEYYLNPEFVLQKGLIDPNPAAPTVQQFMPLTPQYGYGGVMVKIPNTNNNGDLLKTDNLSYSILINGKNIIFDPEAYTDFTEPTQWIPFNHTSFNVEASPADPNIRMVFMYDELTYVETIQVQSRYKSDDGFYVTNGPVYTYEEPAPPGFTIPDNTIMYALVVGDTDMYIEEDGDYPYNVGTVFVWDPKYGLVADATANNETYYSDCWAYTQTIDLKDVETANVVFMQAAKNYNSQEEFLEHTSVCVREVGGEWKEIEVAPEPVANQQGHYVTSEGKLDEFAGKEIEIGFHYTSTSEAAGKWKLKNLFVYNTGNSAVSSVSAENEAPVYFNVQGMRVEKPEKGIYIERRGNKVRKVVIR